MTPAEEAAYERGVQRAYLNLLQECLVHLPTQHVRYGELQKERQETVLTLRVLCAVYGDNDWADDLYLPDVIEKHLAPYLDNASSP